jgi:hypothetical protein
VCGLLKEHEVGTLLSTSLSVGAAPINGVNELTDSYIAFQGPLVDFHLFFSGVAVNGVVSINATSATANFLFCFTATWPAMRGESLFLAALRRNKFVPAIVVQSKDWEYSMPFAPIEQRGLTLLNKNHFRLAFAKPEMILRGRGNRDKIQEK